MLEFSFDSIESFEALEGLDVLEELVEAFEVERGVVREEVVGVSVLGLVLDRIVRSLGTERILDPIQVYILDPFF